jgi:hypothetical protein
MYQSELCTQSPSIPAQVLQTLYMAGVQRPLVLCHRQKPQCGHRYLLVLSHGHMPQCGHRYLCVFCHRHKPQCGHRYLLVLSHGHMPQCGHRYLGYTLQDVWRSDDMSRRVLNSPADSIECQLQDPDSSCSEKHLSVGRWVGGSPGLDAAKKRKCL